jgi:hypothetical protein
MIFFFFFFFFYFIIYIYIYIYLYKNVIGLWFKSSKLACLFYFMFFKPLCWKSIIIFNDIT